MISSFKEIIHEAHCFSIVWDESIPGYKHAIIHPYTQSPLTSAKATLGTAYGNQSSEWSQIGGKLDLVVSIPFNTSATVHLPSKPGETIKESGNPIEKADVVKYLKTENGYKVYEISSGSYCFRVNRQR